MFSTKGQEKKRAHAAALQPRAIKAAAAAAAAKRQRGADPRAKELLELERALPIQEAAYGADHVNVASTLVNLGMAYRKLGDAARAKELYERALTIKEAAYGADHVNVASTLGNLGSAYYSLGDAARAKALFERAWPILVAAQHPSANRVRGAGRVIVIPWCDAT